MFADDVESGEEVQSTPTAKKQKTNEANTIVRRDPARAIVTEQGQYFHQIRTHLRETGQNEEQGETNKALAQGFDEHVMLSNEFMKDEDFIKSDEFKKILTRLKQKQ